MAHTRLLGSSPLSIRSHEVPLSVERKTPPRWYSATSISSGLSGLITADVKSPEGNPPPRFDHVRPPLVERKMNWLVPSRITYGSRGLMAIDLTVMSLGPRSTCSQVPPPSNEANNPCRVPTRILLAISRWVATE